MMSMQMGFTDKFTLKVIEIFEVHIADIAACNVTWRPVSILARPCSYPFTAAKALFQQNAKHIATAYSQPNPIEEALCFHCWDPWPWRKCQWKKDSNDSKFTPKIKRARKKWIEKLPTNTTQVWVKGDDGRIYHLWINMVQVREHYFNLWRIWFHKHQNWKWLIKPSLEHSRFFWEHPTAHPSSWRLTLRLL